MSHFRKGKKKPFKPKGRMLRANFSMDATNAALNLRTQATWLTQEQAEYAYALMFEAAAEEMQASFLERVNQLVADAANEARFDPSKLTPP